MASVSVSYSQYSNTITWNLSGYSSGDSVRYYLRTNDYGGTGRGDTELVNAEHQTASYTYSSLVTSQKYAINYAVNGTWGTAITFETADFFGSFSVTSTSSGTESISIYCSCTRSEATGKKFKAVATCNGTTKEYNMSGSGTSSFQFYFNNLSRSTTYSYSIVLQESTDGGSTYTDTGLGASGSVTTRDCCVIAGCDSYLTGSTVTVNGQSGGFYFDTGTRVTISISNIPSTARFVRWEESGYYYGDQETFTFVTIADDFSFEAIGAPSTHEVTITILNDQGEAKGNKTAPTGAGSYSKDATVTLTTDTLKYYTFDGWYRSGSRVETNTTYQFTMPDEAVSCTAKYIRTPAFNWTNTIAPGVPISNLTASDWKAIQDKIDLFYANDLTWTRAGTESGQTPNITAAMFNEVVNALSGISSPGGPGALTPTKTQGDRVMAVYFNGDGTASDSSIKAALNRIISSG